jgi:hypothetical protein
VIITLATPSSVNASLSASPDTGTFEHVIV